MMAGPAFCESLVMSVGQGGAVLLALNKKLSVQKRRIRFCL